MKFEDSPLIKIVNLKSITNGILALVDVESDRDTPCWANPVCQCLDEEANLKRCELCQFSYHLKCVESLNKSDQCGCHLVRAFKNRFRFLCRNFKRF